MMSLLGLEIDLGRCRAVLVSKEGQVLLEIARENDRVVGLDGVRELEVRAVWAAVQECIMRAVTESRRDPVEAICVASMGETITPLSREGRVLGRRLLGSDPRGARFVRLVERQLGRERLFEITGHSPGSGYSLGKLCWLRHQEPELFDESWRFVLTSGLITHLLGGAPTCDYSLAGTTLIFDMTRKSWSQEILEIADVPAFKLPELGEAGTSVGKITSRGARRMGLEPNTRLILGGRDLACNALGAGAIESGMITFDLGASMHLLSAFPAAPPESALMKNGLNVENHVVPGLLTSLIVNRSGGRVLDWFREHLAPIETRSAERRGYNIFTRLLSEMPEDPTRLTALPGFTPSGAPYFRPGSSGALLGLDLDTTRGDIIKALLEGLTYYFADVQDLLRKIGLQVEVYRATGGGANSDRWLQMIADILGAPVERTELVNAAPVGAAILAGVGCGAFANMEEGVDALVRVTDSFEPDDSRHRIYQDKLAGYRELGELLRQHEAAS